MDDKQSKGNYGEPDSDGHNASGMRGCGCMNKSLREGVDVRIAFASAAKQMVHGDEPMHVNDNHRRIGVLARGGKFLRGMLDSIRRLIKKLVTPFAKRIALKVKHYLMDDLTLELRDHMDELSSRFDRIEEYITSRLDRIEEYSYASARRLAVNCGEDAVLIRTEVGFVLCPSTDHALLACLLENGELERGTRLAIQRLLQPGCVFVDVGANIGLHTIAAARAMRGQGKIVAFEPFEATKRLLEKSIWLNGFSRISEVYHAAVSNRAGRQMLFLGATSGHHSLFEVEDHLASEAVEVPVVTLDGIIGKTQTVDLIKIDVEGAELNVVQGAGSVIRNNPEIGLIVELGLSHLLRVGLSLEEWLSIFTSLGLIYRVINAATGVLEACSLDELKTVDSVNLFFALPTAAAWQKLAHIV